MSEEPTPEARQAVDNMVRLALSKDTDKPKASEVIELAYAPLRAKLAALEAGSEAAARIMGRLQKRAEAAEAKVQELREKVVSLEWACGARYGPQCPACHGSKRGSYGYVEAGHAEDCWLKELCDAALGSESREGS
jgi:hypothetical protein